MLVLDGVCGRPGGWGGGCTESVKGADGEALGVGEVAFVEALVGEAVHILAFEAACALKQREMRSKYLEKGGRCHWVIPLSRRSHCTSAGTIGYQIESLIDVWLM